MAESIQGNFEEGQGPVKLNARDILAEADKARYAREVQGRETRAAYAPNGMLPGLETDISRDPKKEEVRESPYQALDSLVKEHYGGDKEHAKEHASADAEALAILLAQKGHSSLDAKGIRSYLRGDFDPNVK